MQTFINNQILSIKKNGLKVLPHKIYVLMTLILLFIPVLITLLIFRAISSITLIRLVPLNLSRIGAFYPQYWYLRLKKAGVLNENNKIFYLFFINDKFKVNKTWMKLWKRSINIFPLSFFFKKVYSYNKFLFSDHKKFEASNLQSLLHNFYLSKKNRLTENFKKEDIIKISEISSDYISFNQEEKKRAKTPKCKEKLQILRK